MSTALPSVRHVAALGSSFASGPGLAPYENRAAARSTRNYAHLVARALGARLTDLTVAGATTATILRTPQRRAVRTFAPQLSQVPADVDLVTVTAGGNDLDYLGAVIRFAAAGKLARHALTRGVTARMTRSGMPTITDGRVKRAAAGLTEIVTSLAARAPSARVLLVDYLTVLDADLAPSAAAPFAPEVRDALRAIAAGVSAAYARAAAATGAELVPMAQRSEGHGLGSAEPWVRDAAHLRGVGSWFHPTAEGMAAVSAAILDQLAQQPRHR